MLSDPISVTYNGSAKSLPRSSGVKPTSLVPTQSTVYSTPDREFEIKISKYRTGEGVNRYEVILGRVTPDTSIFDGNTSLPNRVGLVYEVNDLMYATSVDIPLLRTALLALVDSTLQGRIVGGEQ